MFHILVDDEIQLGLLEKRHAQELIDLQNEGRDYLKEWLPWLDYSTTKSDAEEFISRSLQQFAQQDGFQLGIFYKGKLAGVIGLHNISWSNRTTSIGYWLGQRYQGHGIMRRACQRVIDYCFHEYDLNRIEISAAEGNAKSQAIPRNLSFREEGVMYQKEWLYDRFVDHIPFSLLREDYLKRK